MKKILFFLLFTVSIYGQTYQNPTYGTVTEKNNATDNTPAYFTTTQVDGVHKKTPAALIATTQAVQDSLDLKQNALGYTPENVANKQNSLAVDETGVKYPTVDAVNKNLVNKSDTEGSRLNELITPIYAWGDSMTGGAGQTSYPTYLSNITKYEVTNKGVGGESSTQIKDRMIAEPANYSKSVIIWVGRNNYTFPAIVKSDIATMVSALGHTRYLIIGVVNQNTALEYVGQSEWVKITTLNNDLKTLYGNKFIDIRPYLVSLHTQSAQDLIDFANDVPPTSLRIDLLHLTSAGNAKVADYINKSLGILYENTAYLQSKDFKYYFENNSPLHTLSNETFTGVKSSTNTSSGNLNGIALINNGTVGSYSQSITTINSGAGLDLNSTGSSVGNLVEFRKNSVLTGYVGAIGNIVGAGIRTSGYLDIRKTRPALADQKGLFMYIDSNTGTSTQLFSTASSANSGILFNAYYDNSSAVFPSGLRQTENGNSFGLRGGYFNFVGNGGIFKWGMTSSYIDGSGKDSTIASTELMSLNSSGTLTTSGGFLGNLTGTSIWTNGIIPAGVSSQYWKGNNVWGDFNSSAISSVLTGYLSGAGTVSSSDSILQSIQKIDGNIALKSPIASPTFTGTVSGITKSMVGLSNVDNTTDVGKPVSTATQTALDLKANLASPTFTGTPTAPTATAGTNTTQIATTAFVQAAIGNYKKYVALLSQSGANAPTATVLENTLGGTVVWTRNSTGLYTGTLAGVFTANKTWTSITSTTTGTVTGAVSTSVDSVVVATSSSDSSLTNSAIEIRVYN